VLRALAPSLAVLLVFMVGVGIALHLGAPAWAIYLAGGLGPLIVFPAYLRWDLEHFPDDD
jgi:hypothetical protein